MSGRHDPPDQVEIDGLRVSGPGDAGTFNNLVIGIIFSVILAIGLFLVFSPFVAQILISERSFFSFLLSPAMIIVGIVVILFDVLFVGLTDSSDDKKNEKK